MATLQINGYLKSPSIWGAGDSEENNNGINFKSGSLYLYGKTTSDTRGIYDSLVGSVISVTNSGMYFYGNANSATNSDTLDGYHASSFLQLSGGTMSGALNFANGTWNLLGDDVYFGDNNIAGAFCIKGANGTTNLRMVQYDSTAAGTISFDGSSFTISNYINGTISNASKWATARTLSLIDAVTGSVSFDGSGNATMSTTIKFVGITPSTFASNFRTMIKGNASSGQFFSTIRSESSQSGQLSAYGSGLAWGTHDTHGYMYINYSTPQIFVGGGNGNILNWTKQLAFTDSTVAGANYASSAGNADTIDGYHAASFAVASHTHSYVPTSSGSMSGILTLTKNSWNTTSHYSNAGLYFNAVTNANVSSTYYKPWISGIMYHSGVGYGNTVVVGQFSDSCSSCGFYIGHSWDGNNSDTFYKFYRDGHFHVPRPVTSNYGTSFPSGTHIGEIYFYTG